MYRFSLSKINKPILKGFKRVGKMYIFEGIHYDNYLFEIGLD